MVASRFSNRDPQLQVKEKQEKRVVSQSFHFDGLASYATERDAIVAEDSNDPVHMVYGDKLAEKTALFLERFTGACLYAVKANPHPSVLKFLWERGVRKFEMASLREVEFISEMFPDAEMYFMHPVKSRKAIRFSFERGVRSFAYDSVDELRKIEEETEFATDLNLFLRIRVDQTASAHPLSGKFGATFNEAPLLLQRASKYCKSLGITFHVGSQCLDPQSYVTAITQLSNMLRQSGCVVDRLDVGGGFPVSYPGMQPAPLTTYFDAIHKALEDADLSALEILCEPGRALVAEGGGVAVRVEMRKGQMLYLNDGTYGSLFDAGVSAWPYPLDAIRVDGEGLDHELSAFKLYGPTCDSLDVMEGPYMLPDNIAEGDWIVFRHLGAYGYAMQTRFNGFYSDKTVAIG